MPFFGLSVTQLLLAFVSANLIGKLTLNRSFLRWLASHNFVYYLPPTDFHLKQLKEYESGRHKKRQKSRDATKHRQDENFFKIPAASLVDLYLQKAILKPGDLASVKYAMDLEWLVDLAIMSIFSFFVTELQFYVYPNTKEYNFSILWALMVVFFCIRTLWNLTIIYFKSEQSVGERSICIASAVVFLLVSMLVTMTKDSYLELGLSDLFGYFNQMDTSKYSYASIRSASVITKLVIFLTSSIVGVLFTFPGFRQGQLHKSISDHPDTSPLKQVVLNLNYLSSLIVTLLWMRPIARAPLVTQQYLQIDDNIFETLRIYLVVTFCLFRFYHCPKYAAAFLLSANKKIIRIRQRGGSTTNREVQTSVASIYNYANVVVIQYILPILISLFTVIMYKYMGNFQWIPTFSSSLSMSSTNGSLVTELVNMTGSGTKAEGLGGHQLLHITNQIDGSYLEDFKKTLSEKFFTSLLGYATWWLHFTWFSTTTFGLIYHSSFSS